MRLFFFFGLVMVWGLQGKAQDQSRPQSMRNAFVESIEFTDAPLSDVLYYLSTKARQDNIQPANFVVYDPIGLRTKEPEITLSLKKLPFSEVVRYVALLSQNSLLTDRNTVFFGNRSDLTSLSTIRKINSKQVMKRPVMKSLRNSRFNNIEFDGASLNEVASAMRHLERSRGRDGNFVVITGENKATAENERITMALNNVSTADIVQYAAELSGYQLDSNGSVVMFRAPDAREPAKAAENKVDFYLDTLVIKQLSVEEVSLRKALEFVAQLSNGLNVINNSKAQDTVTLDLYNITVLQALRYINEQTSTVYQVQGNIIEIVDRPPEVTTEEQQVAITQESIF